MPKPGITHTQIEFSPPPIRIRLAPGRQLSMPQGGGRGSPLRPRPNADLVAASQTQQQCTPLNPPSLRRTARRTERFVGAAIIGDRFASQKWREPEQTCRSIDTRQVRADANWKRKERVCRRILSEGSSSSPPFQDQASGASVLAGPVHTTQV